MTELEKLLQMVYEEGATLTSYDCNNGVITEYIFVDEDEEQDSITTKYT